MQWFAVQTSEAAKRRFKSCCFHSRAVGCQSSSGNFLNPVSKRGLLRPTFQLV